MFQFHFTTSTRVNQQFYVNIPNHMSASLRYYEFNLRQVMTPVMTCVPHSIIAYILWDINITLGIT